MNTNQHAIKIIDKIIFFFIVLFLGSLTNSIFVNQLGYYGALIFILVRFGYSRENPFFKTGLELAFLLFIVAEIMSTVFAQYQDQSFTNLLKRVLLIPTFYTIAVSVKDIKRAKLVFNIYIVFALVSCLIYLYMAYDYWIYDQFSIKGSGPSVFQYPITASELISFTTVLLFAFLVNEKLNLKYKLLTFAAFLISSLALLSTFKRTGWVGTAAGIIAILIAKKQWKLIGVGFAAVIIVFVLQKNESKIIEYNFKGEVVNSIVTEGKLLNLCYEDGQIIASEYNKGLAVYENKDITRHEMPGAVKNFSKWNDSIFVAQLMDTRFILVKKEGETFNQLDEFFSPGLLAFTHIQNSYFYASDKDSGLTVFRNPSDLSDFVRAPEINECSIVRIDSINLYTYSKIHGIKIYKLEDGIPSELIFETEPFDPDIYVDFIDNEILVSSNTNSDIYNYDKNILTKKCQIDGLKSVFDSQFNDDFILFLTKTGYLQIAEIDTTDNIELSNSINLGYVPHGILYAENRLFVRYVKESRLLSIFDPNKFTNVARFVMWRVGWEMFKDYPIFGVGDSDLNELFRIYKRPFDKDVQGHLHNNYFHILATLGGFGFIVFVYLFVKIMQFVINSYRKTKSIPFASSYSLGAIGVVVSFLFAGLTEWNFGDHEIITMLWFVLGLNAALWNLARRNEI